tara:strand:+ start:1193 stop:1456 length:264 start_codon:yes stop_codon:yes gene_type:complete
MKENKIKLCAHCDGKLSTCSCAWKGTSDKKLVHKHCYEQYEANFKNKPLTCAHCESVFTEKPYFKTQNGKFVHFACQYKYEKELINK